MSSHTSPPSPAARILRLQIEAMIQQATPDRAIDGLKEIFKNHGHEVSVGLLLTGSAEYAFLIDFENSQDAVNASLELNYLLFGHSTLVIHTRHDGGRPAQ